jgi:hypothetical protein
MGTRTKMLRLQRMGLMEERRQDRLRAYWLAERDRTEREQGYAMHKFYEDQAQKRLAEEKAKRLSTRIRKWWNGLFFKDASIPCGIGIDHKEDMPPEGK